MAHVKEPEGVDFVINSKPLTPHEKLEISALIASMKTKTKRERIVQRKNTKKENME
ncbi:MAG: hypothetical protein H0S84_11280 [Bacteroidales bacterium]|jgi:hypothetical protein|nr:hypothetical protein [Bacteroidales bacterium]